MTPTPAEESARAKFGSVLRFTIREHKIQLHRVAHRARASTSDVEAWLAGRLVPTSDQWRALINGIHRSLARYSDLYRDARTEQETERRALTRSMIMHTRNGTDTHAPIIGTSLASKLADVRLEPPAVEIHPPRPDPPQVPDARPRKEQILPPAHRDLGTEPDGRIGSDGRRIGPPRPSGSASIAAQERRLAFVREFLRARPHAKCQGQDGVVAAVRKTFGVGITPAYVEMIRRDLAREHGAAPELPPAPAPPVVVPAPVLAAAPSPAPPLRQVAPAADAEANIASAVGLIVQEIPGLRSMTITVDDEGNATYSYEVRTVRAGAGVVKR